MVGSGRLEFLLSLVTFFFLFFYLFIIFFLIVGSEVKKGNQYFLRVRPTARPIIRAIKTIATMAAARIMRFRRENWRTSHQGAGDGSMNSLETGRGLRGGTIDEGNPLSGMMKNADSK